MKDLKPGYTIMVENPDSRSSFLPIRDNNNNILTFDTPDEAFKYFRDEYWSDTSQMYLVEFHDYELKLVRE